MLLKIFYNSRKFDFPFTFGKNGKVNGPVMGKGYAR